MNSDFVTEEDAQTLQVMWEDTLLDKISRRFLRDMENGKYLSFDIVAHLEFFYNTLLLSHETRNPFKIPRKYQALRYPQF